MTITAEELRKVYDTTFNRSWHCLQPGPTGDALLAVARYVAEKQRALDPTEEMIAAMPAPAGLPLWPIICADVYRAMSSVAPLVVPE